MAGAGEWTRFASSLDRFASELRASDAAGVSGAALHVKRSIESEASAQGVGRLGRVGYDTRSGDALVRATNRKAHLPERGTKAHPIQGGYSRAQIGKALRALFGGQQRSFSTKARKQAIAWPGGPHPVNVVEHPGEKPRPFFWPGVDKALPNVSDAYEKAVDRQAAQAWR